ncbi:hypothetical protein E4U13_000612 [Claviceps humidiphila]|uniref:Helitron helicase-like domain-containing protein n=1 Tax=Claviceps humidiphila TaxID=1294629 RepID=A0A9P7TM64_9HYPO|nr:hypothetical protein E4U13_000612 [Claviceps humidiphila]
MKEVITKKFDIVDSWWRVEFQARGSPHVHMLVWLNDCPVLEVKDGDAAAAAHAETAFLAFFKDKVTSWNPTVGVPPAPDTNPLIRHGDFTLRNLSAILNRVQVHMCTDSYCLRTANARPEHVDGDNARPEQVNGEKVCMFHLPKNAHLKANWRQALPVSLPQGYAPTTDDRPYLEPRLRCL